MAYSTGLHLFSIYVDELSLYTMNSFFDELHKPRKAETAYRKVVSDGKADIYSADLIDLTRYKSENSGYGWILPVIDVYTRRATAVPVKTKTAASVLAGYKKAMKFFGIQPRKLWTDRGKEFYNRTFQAYLQENHTEIYSTFSEKKAVLVERFNRTLLTRLFKQMTTKKTRRWTNLLRPILKAYNDSEHRTLRHTPNDVWNNPGLVVVDVPNVPKKRNKFKKGDVVRIVYPKKLFDKGYYPNWSWDVYKVTEVYPTQPTTYGITNGEGEKMPHKYYDWELIRTSQEHGIYHIEKVIKRKKVDGVEFSLVKWVGYPSSQNSWIPTDDVSDIA